VLGVPGAIGVTSELCRADVRIDPHVGELGTPFPVIVRDVCVAVVEEAVGDEQVVGLVAAERLSVPRGRGEQERKHAEEQDEHAGRHDAEGTRRLGSGQRREGAICANCH
jgi:hypothetical protein